MGALLSQWPKVQLRNPAPPVAVSEIQGGGRLVIPPPSDPHAVKCNSKVLWSHHSTSGVLPQKSPTDPIRFRFHLKSLAAVQNGRSCFHRSHNSPNGLEVEVADPVDDIKEQEGRGKENPGVRIQLADVDVDSSSSPAAFFTLLVTAEEALAVFPVQALVQAAVVVVVPEQGVAHGYHGSWTAGCVERRVGLQDKEGGDCNVLRS